MMTRALFALMMLAGSSAAMADGTLVTLHIQDRHSAEALDVSTALNEPALVTFDDGETNYFLTPTRIDNGDIWVDVETVPVGAANRWRRGEAVPRKEFRLIRQIHLSDG